MLGFVVLHFVSNILLLSENISDVCVHPILLTTALPSLEDFCSFYGVCNKKLLLRGQQVTGNWTSGFTLPDLAWIGDKTDNCQDWLPEPSERYLRGVLTDGQRVSCQTRGVGVYCLLEWEV